MLNSHRLTHILVQTQSLHLANLTSCSTCRSDKNTAELMCFVYIYIDRYSSKYVCAYRQHVRTHTHTLAKWFNKTSTSSPAGSPGLPWLLFFLALDAQGAHTHTAFEMNNKFMFHSHTFKKPCPYSKVMTRHTHKQTHTLQVTVTVFYMT